MKIGNHKEVKSFTDPKKQYRVYSTQQGYKCTCKAFGFRKNDHFVCKHIEQLIKTEKRVCKECKEDSEKR